MGGGRQWSCGKGDREATFKSVSYRRGMALPSVYCWRCHLRMCRHVGWMFFVLEVDDKKYNGHFVFQLFFFFSHETLLCTHLDCRGPRLLPQLKHLF